MVVSWYSAYLCEIRPFILEGFCSSFYVLFKSSLIDIREVDEITVNECNLLVSDIFLFYIAEDVMMKL